MTHAQAQTLLAQAFESCVTEAEEAILDKLEQEWLTMCRAVELESYDYYSIGQVCKGSITLSIIIILTKQGGHMDIDDWIGLLCAALLAVLLVLVYAGLI